MTATAPLTPQVPRPAAILTAAPRLLPLLVALLALSAACFGQAGDAPDLYRRLASVGLNPDRVYRVADLSLDRQDIHVSFNDGTIAFTHAVDGHVTGAFFEGEGEVLLLPPDSVERGTMALFTGAAILDERFRIAYLRFDDGTARELMDQLRYPADDAADFVARWDASARSLALNDSLRLLAAFTSAQEVPADDRYAGAASRFLHITFNGLHLGSFDVNCDTSFPEQIFAGQPTEENGVAYYNLWTAFPMRSARTASPPHADPGPIVRITAVHADAQVILPHDLQAETRLSLEGVRGGERTIIFELSRYLKVQSVTSGGKPVDFVQNLAIEGSDLARRGNDVVAVILPRPIDPGQKLELTLTYGGTVISEAGGGLMYVGARGAWYPNLGLGMADFDLTFRYPPGWTLVATGKRVSLRTVASSQESRWVSESPIPLAGFNLGQYVETDARAGQVAVQSFAAPGLADILPPEPMAPRKFQIEPRDPSKSNLDIVAPPSAGGKAADVAQRAVDAIDFLAPRLGPFPFSSLALTQMPGRDSQGWPGLIFLSSYVFLAPKDRSGRLTDYGSLLYDRIMLSHEVAHQWWGDTVTWQSYRDQWLIEALANYCALMPLETSNPAGFRLVMDHYRRDLLVSNLHDEAALEAGPVTLGLRLNSSHFPAGYDVVSYGRGTWMLHMLRSLLRPGDTAAPAPDDPFLKVLRDIGERYRGKALSTSAFLHAFEPALPRSAWYDGKPSLDWFDRGWVNGTAMPKLSLAAVKFSPSGSGQTASGRLLQQEAPDSLVTPVPVYASAGGGKLVFLGLVFADGPETAFRLTAPAGVRKLVLDPYSTVLTRP